MSPRTADQLEALRTERKEAILEAALHVFADDGFHKSSVSQIARKAGVSKGLLYNYFESKEAVLVELVLGLFGVIGEEFAIDENTPANRESMLRFIDKSFDVVLRDPAHWRLYMSIILQPKVAALVMEQMFDRAAPYMNLMMNYFASCGHEDPVATMRYFSATVDGIQMHLLLDAENFPLEPIKQMLIEQFIQP